MTPHVGVLLPTRELAMVGTYEMAPLLSFAQEAETAGYDSLWTGDSLLARPRLDPFVVLSAAAAVTSRITLGTAALTAALRQPVIGANLVASLDHATAGRLVIGLGAGFPIPDSAAEFAAVGVPFEQRVGRLDETVRLWRQVWSGGGPATGTYQGRYWQLENLDRLPLPATPGGPKLWLASSDTPRVLHRVATRYDGWLPFLPSAAAYGTAWRRISDLAEENGRPAGQIVPALYATVTVNDDRERARAELEDYLQRYYGRPLEVMSTVQAYCYGTVEDCAEWLASYVEAGARHLVVRIGSLRPDLPLKEILAAARQIS